MAELASVGVASCILQVIDFGAKVIKTTYMLISASQDALREEIHLTRLVREQDDLARRLHDSINARPFLSANEKTVVDLASVVRSEAHELLSLLGEFKIASIGQSKFRKTIQSAGIAVRILRKRNEVEDRRKRLQLVNEQLATALMSVVREQNEQMNLELRIIQQTSEGNTQNILAAVMSMQNELSKLFYLHEERRENCQRSIISDIGFADMQSRQHSIRNAHQGTYDWALTKDISGLATWLRTGSDIFWVSGKAGSGKSTFMKFLGNEKRTSNLLCEWSGNHASLIVVNCYFWYLGTSLQKSIEGLLRTILYQILRKDPGMVEVLFPSRWERQKSGAKDMQAWTIEELRTALEDLGNHMTRTTQGQHPRKVCVFIDGLDEYSRDHGELIHTLQTFVKDGNTKLCVSSRPWNVFAKAFGDKTPHLFLHEVTEGDIRLFVESNLELRLVSSSPPSFPTPETPDEHLISIANDIILRAEGVFLWVYLVVRSVVRGLREGDEPMTLRERVLELPTDLESFFESILDRIDSVYHHQTAQALVLAYLYAEGHDEAAARSSYLDFELLFRQHVGLHDTRFLWALKPQKMTYDQFAELAKRTRERLSASCKDLLLMVVPQSFWLLEDPSRVKVQFLHRTVFEYLKSSGRIGELQKKVPPCFYDGSVFHLLNMGKLKLVWDRQPWDRPPEAPSGYFLSQVSFSLDHGWPGLDVGYIDQLQQCQVLHQSALSASIAAAYIAFEQFDTFQRIHTTTSSQQLVARFGSDSRRFANKLKKFAQITWELEPLLAASLGMSLCRKFDSDNIDMLTLASILGTISESASRRTVTDFFNCALPPLLQACETASTDSESWNQWFGSRTMHHMYDVTQTLMYSGHARANLILSLQWPATWNRFRDSIWTYLTTRSEAWERRCGLLGSYATSLDSWAQHLPYALSAQDRATPPAIECHREVHGQADDNNTCGRHRDSVWRGQRSSISPLDDDLLELRQFCMHMQELQDNLRRSDATE